MSGFEPVESRRQHQVDAELRINPDRPTAYISAGAVRQHFEDVDRVLFHTDWDRSLLALVPDDGEHSYSVSHKASGAVIAVRHPLRELDIELDAIQETHACQIRQDEQSGFIIADLSQVVEAATDDTHCPECENRFTEQGVKTHLTRNHGEDPKSLLEEMDPDEIGDSFPDGDDSWKRTAQQDGEKA